MFESLLADFPDEIHARAPLQMAFRAKQIWEWVHQKRVAEFAAMPNLPAALRAEFAKNFTLREFDERGHWISADRGAEKWLYLSGGDAIETALIREQRGKRRTLCVSCMCGCPVGCVFCATGRGGWRRNLTAAEIIEQVYRAETHCEKVDGAGLTNLVLMGMGEPLLNYDAMLRALKIINAARGMNFGSRRITLSTVGIPEKILQLARDYPAVKLAFSLHAPSQELRERLIPSAKKYPLPEIIAALEKFAAQTSRPLTIEYCLLAGLNDSPAHARATDKLLRNLPAKINVIPFNRIRVRTPKLDTVAGRGQNSLNLPPLQTPTRAAIRAFIAALKTPATLRAEKGGDINAACGQLRSDYSAVAADKTDESS